MRDLLDWACENEQSFVDYLRNLGFDEPEDEARSQIEELEELLDV